MQAKKLLIKACPNANRRWILSQNWRSKNVVGKYQSRDAWAGLIVIQSQKHLGNHANLIRPLLTCWAGFKAPMNP
ncbi:hypothetical protein R50072_24090 [Simiduia litorea]